MQNQRQQPPAKRRKGEEGMINPELNEGMNISMQQKKKDTDETIQGDKRPRYDIRNYLGTESRASKR